MLNTRSIASARCGALVLVLAALAGCGGHARDSDSHAAGAPPAATSTRYVAVARGRVDVEGGMLDLYAPVSGTVDSVPVHEGADVTKGQLLASLDRQSAQAQVDIAQGKLAQAKAHAKALADRLAAARRDASKLRAAADAGAGSQHDADAAAQKVQQLDAERDAATAQQSVARGELAIARRQLALHRITAPVAGQVTQLHVQPGSRAVAGSTPILELLPDRPRIVRAELDQEYVDAVHPGMRAQVVLDNDRQTPLGNARVVRVGAVYSPSRLQDNPALTAGTRTVPCVLRFDTPSHLRIGQLVLVRILPAHAPAAAHSARKGS